MAATLQRLYFHGDVLSGGNGGHGVAEGRAELRGGDFEDIPGLGLDAGNEAQRGGAKVVDVEVAGTPEVGVFEMVMLDIGDGVAHVRLAGQERRGPELLAVADDARRALDVLRRFAQQY